MNGWIKLHRRIVNSEVFKNSKTVHVWLWCLCKASHKQHDALIGNQVIQLNKGQFICGRKKAADELNMAETTFRDQLNVLKKLGMISTTATNKYTVVTIENWEIYQGQNEDYHQQTANKPTTNHHKQENKESNKFIPPTIEEVTFYCTERNNNIDANEFIDFYTAKGWMVGKNKMKDWKAAIRNWERNSKYDENKQRKKYG